MVRILKVKELDDRRRLLVARSETYRQTLRLEVTDLQASVSDLKEKFGFLGIVRRFLGITASLAGLLFDRKQTRTGNESGFISRLFSGIKFAAEFLPFLKKFTEAAPVSEEEPVAAPDSERTL